MDRMDKSISLFSEDIILSLDYDSLILTSAKYINLYQP